MGTKHLIGGILVAALAAAACSGGSNTPTAPSGATATVPTVSAKGATIAGHVTAAPSSSTANGIGPVLGIAGVTSALPPMTASVVGTPISAAVGTTGAFVLEGVPQGPVELRFSGSGVNASVTLPPVTASDTVSVLIGIAGNAATLECESRNAGGQVEFEGRIESVPPTQPENTLVVSGRTVSVSLDTSIRQGSATVAFSALAVGQRVHVKGRLDGASIAASLITLQNTNASIPVVINGVVESVSGNASAFVFFVGGREIRGDATTTFFGNGDVQLGFGAITVGASVNVKGLQRDAFVFAERVHVAGVTTTPEPQEQSASIEGRLEAVAGTAPLLTLTIGTTTVTTTSATEVRRGGDVQPLSALAIGQTIHAVGTRLANGTLAARMLQIKGDEPGGAFLIEGSLGGLKGTCPALTFGVNGYSIVTSATTTFGPGTDACAGLKSGSKVEVEGKKQANGSVMADKVTRK